jgi:hypothetical protein
MAEFGALIIENPGPETRIRYEDLTGCEPELKIYSDAEKIVQQAIAVGGLAHVLVIFPGDECDGYIQLCAYDRQEAADAGVLNEKEIAQDGASTEGQ